MPLLVNELPVWDIGFRLAGHEPRKLWFRVPIEVEDHFRNFMDAILHGNLACLNITLEKRHFEPDEKKHSIYYWIDDIYACIQGRHYNRKLLRWAHIERFDLMLWCERMNVPLPEFWFPPGWKLQYELPEGHIHPGYRFIQSNWTREEFKAWLEERDALDAKRANEASQSLLDGSTASQPLESSSPPDDTNPMEGAVNKIRPNQEARIACQQIARAIWKNEPDRTIASVVKDELIQKYGGGGFYEGGTVREWVKVVAPSHVRSRRGAPRKNRGEDR
jgi:hypothetical protein